MITSSPSLRHRVPTSSPKTGHKNEAKALSKPEKHESDVFPYGQSLFPIVWRRDPTHPALKWLYLVSTSVGMIILCILPWIMVNLLGVGGEWDARHGIDVGGDAVNAILVLFEQTMDLSPQPVYRTTGITLVTIGLLVAIDIMGGMLGLREIWPKSWNTDNRQCYEEMFSEPTRLGRLLRRPGNTLSNVTFYFGSLCILLSVYNTMIGKGEENIFVVSDGMFGAMLFLLGLFSSIWHGSNAPWSQYPDLWSMESCIFYLIIRYCCLAGLSLLKTVPSIDARTAELIASRSCTAIYTLIIYGLGRIWTQHYKKRLLHGGCVISGRSRLLKKSNVMGQGHIDCMVSTITVFQSLPIFYLGLPTLIELLILKDCGSSLAGYITCISLTVGWGYRLFDRWLIDGCVPLNLIMNMNEGILRTVGAAFVSPTAVLHFYTGITLLAGYMHARSVESAV